MLPLDDVSAQVGSGAVALLIYLLLGAIAAEALVIVVLFRRTNSLADKVADTTAQGSKELREMQAETLRATAATTATLTAATAAMTAATQAMERR